MNNDLWDLKKVSYFHEKFDFSIVHKNVINTK